MPHAIQFGSARNLMTNADQTLSSESESIEGMFALRPRVPTKVLIVDDETAACKLLALILTPPAFHCTVARNAEEALTLLQHQHFHAVVSDLHMPGMSGMELLTAARRRYPHLAFLVTTGVDDVDVGAQGMRPVA